MGEDMMYTETEPTRAQLAARVRELERQQAAIPVAAILREWDGHGSADDTAAIEVWIQQLWQSQQAITVLCGEVQP